FLSPAATIDSYTLSLHDALPIWNIVPLRRMTMELDRYDRQILDELQKNGRISNQELAETISLSPSPCLRRVRQLEEAGLIDGYVDRKSTRLNSSHVKISYAVFSL